MTENNYIPNPDAAYPATPAYPTYPEAGASATLDPYASSAYAQPRANQTNGLAIAGLICAFVAPLVGLILSIIASKKSKELNGEGKGMATAGIIISIIGLILLTIYIILRILFVFDTVMYG